MDYEDKALLSYLGNEKGFDWYKKAFAKNDEKNGKFAWSWSLWAFLGGGWYLIYRRAYIEGICLLILGVVLLFRFPAMMLALKLSMGGIAPYIVYVKYKNMKYKIEGMMKKESRRLEALEVAGGCFVPAIWMAVAVYSAIILFIAYAYITV